MGYAWNGTCYQDTAAALNAFAAQVPSVSPSGINAFAGAPAIGGGGLISWSITNRIGLCGRDFAHRNDSTIKLQ